MTVVQIDTKQRIIEAASYLFGIKGFEGTTTREISHRAGVNIASLNYHFKSKLNLMEEVAYFAWAEFKKKIVEVSLEPEIKNAGDFAIRLFETFLVDGNKCLNQFKILLNTKNISGDMGETPIAFLEFNELLKKELSANVPHHEYIYFYNIVFCYLAHSAILSMAPVGQMHIENFLPEKHESIKIYLRQLVETLLRDFNQRYP